jgi:aspartate aminotransferase/aminotransferase
MTHPWIADRMRLIDSSGIRKVFDLAAKMTNPVNLSIGQPDFDVPDLLKDAAIDAIREGKNSYALTAGLPALRARLQKEVDAEYGQSDRQLMVTSGTSGGLVLSLMTLVQPGDEVIIFDPYFVMYPALVNLAGGKPVYVNTYPDFRINLDRLRAAITPRTKAILFNSPANPTGVVASEEEVRGLAELAAEKNIALISDEIYRLFCHEPFHSPAKFNKDTIVIDGYSKSYGMTGWRIAFLHGPSAVVEQMIKLQQYTFVCSPTPLQWGALKADQVDMQPHITDYRRKRDLIVAGLKDHYELATPGGAFYVFPKLPWGNGETFVKSAIDNNLLIIPGKIFSAQDTHFRISYAAKDETIAAGVEILKRLAEQAPAVSAG